MDRAAFIFFSFSQLTASNNVDGVMEKGGRKGNEIARHVT